MPTMINLSNIEDKKIQIVLDAEDLKEAFRSVLSDLLSARETEKKDARITRAAAAKRLNKDFSTLNRWARAGMIHPIKVGRTVYFKESEIIAIEEGRYE